MNRENFIVRMHLEAVERFQNRQVWDTLCEADREVLQREVASLPTETGDRRHRVTAVRSYRPAHAAGIR